MSELSESDLVQSAKLRAVTENLFFWQGLRFVPVAAVMAALGLTIAVPGLDELTANVVLVAMLVLGSMAVHLAGLKYRRDMGNVSPIPGAHRKRSRVKWLLVYPIMFAALWLDFRYPQPLFFTGATWAIAVFLYRYSTGGGRDHYLVLAGVLGAFTLAPLVAKVEGAPLVGLFMLVLGAGMAASFTLDDREMRSVLRGT